MFRLLFIGVIGLILVVSAKGQNSAANQQPRASDVAEERLLPLRGAALLDQLTRPIAMLKNVSVSPDGSKILYKVEMTGGAGVDSLWLVDAAGGKPWRLLGYE